MRFLCSIILLLAFQSFALSTNKVGRAANDSGLTESGGTYIAVGSGSGLWVQTDGFSYFWRGLSGNGSIVARVVGCGGATNVLAGVMLRETLQYDSRFVAAYMATNIAGDGIAYGRARDAYSTYSSLVTSFASSNVAFPRWVKVERQGTTYIASHSADGSTWITNGTSTGMGATNCLYAGLFALNQRDDSGATVTFDNVTITGTEPDSTTFDNEISGVLAARYPSVTPHADLEQINAQAAVTFAARAANASFFTAGKKLIAANVDHDYMVTNFLADIVDREKRPFHGAVLAAGSGLSTPWCPQRARVFNENNFVADYEALTNFIPTKFKDNFMLWRTSELDWFSDQQWGASLTNTTFMAKAALLGGFAGIWMDMEGTGGAFNYRASTKGIGCWQYSWSEYAAKVQERGSNWIQAVEAQLPRAQILFAFLYPQFGKPIGTTTWNSDKITSTYGLIPEFVTGMLLGSTNDNTRFIDGTEAAYASAIQWEALADYTNRLNAFNGASPYYFTNALTQWTNKVRFGLSVMPSRIYTTQASDELDAQFWQNSLYWTLSTADRYVWDWHTSTASNMWSSAWESTTLPYRYTEEILTVNGMLNPRLINIGTLRAQNLILR